MADSQVTASALGRGDIEEQAARIRQAYERRAPISPVRDALPAATIDDAYAVQAVNTTFWEAQGRTIVGAKIGLTAKAVQAQFGVDQPDFGVLFADMAVNDGDTVAAGRLLQPKVEAEVAFVMGRTPAPERLTTAELIDSVAYALPAIEVVDSRIADWDINIVDTVADNASSGLFVLGTRPHRLAEIDLQLCGMVLQKNGEPVSFGAGAACLGHPLHALGWLAAKMAEVGRPVQEGDVILSGALGPIVAAEPGDHIEVRIEGLGAVGVTLGSTA